VMVRLDATVEKTRINFFVIFLTFYPQTLQPDKIFR